MKCATAWYVRFFVVVLLLSVWWLKVLFFCFDGCSVEWLGLFCVMIFNVVASDMRMKK